MVQFIEEKCKMVNDVVMVFYFQIMVSFMRGLYFFYFMSILIRF